MKLRLFIICLFCYLFSYSQQSKENKQFQDFIQSLIRNDENFSSETIINKGDSLYKKSTNDWQKASSLFLIVYGHEMRYNWDEGLVYALKADSIISKANLTTLKPESKGILASLYNSLNLQKESLEYLDEALKYCDKLDREDALLNRSKIYQRMSIVYHRQKKYEKALSTNLEALRLLKELNKEFPKDTDYTTSYISVLINIGINYYNLGQYGLSKEYYQKASKVITDSGHNYYQAYFYIKFAATEIKLNNPDTAFLYLQKAEALTNLLKNRDLEFEMNLRLSEYYTLIDNPQKSDSIKSLIIKNYQDLSESKIDATQSIIKTSKDRIKNEKKTISILIIVSIILFISTIALYVYRHKKITYHFNKVVNEFQNKKLSEIEDSLSSTLIEPVRPDNKEKSLLSESKIEELLQKLEDFENGTEFTAKNFTVSSMASLFKTNSKYINYILQQHRGKNFNDYLNGLRINFVLQKMVNDSEYLNYKIDYLSEISGYSSHSRFSQMFKKEVKISPSEFIAQLRKRNPSSK